MHMRKPILMMGALLLWAALPQEASAVSQAVKDACRGDYQTYCSQHEVGSEALRDCMADAFDKLSEPCVAAILDSELQREHAQQDEARPHKRSQRTAERPAPSQALDRACPARRAASRSDSWRALR